MNPEQILELLRRQGKKIIFAESITGGLLVDAFISVPGASDVVLGSEVTYASELKSALLGVDEALLTEPGAVSEEVATSMVRGVASVAQGALELAPDKVVAISTTGNAGPSAQSGQPVGLAFVALFDGKKVLVRKLQLEGDRRSIRQGVVDAAITLLGEQLSK